MNLSPRTVVHIDVSKIKQNYRTACSLTKAEVTCVLKSNAYGHGMVRIAQALHADGCRSFAVSCGREALALRKAGITGDILVMGALEIALLNALIRENITLTVTSVDDIVACRTEAMQLRQRVKIHIKLDTGFHRLGFDCTDKNVLSIAALGWLKDWVDFEGIYSHFGLIDEAHDIAQVEAFTYMIRELAKRGMTFRCAHICDSIGLVRYPNWHFDRVRVGAFLFGVRPARSEHMPFDDPETLVFQAQVAQVRDVAAGEVIGYGDEQIFDHPVRVATLCAGYGDGYPRRLSYGKAQVSIRGKRCGTIGLICMDQMMVDVSDVPDVQVGDMATLLGGEIPYMEYADWAHSNRNEVITALTNRPIRLYHEDGKPTLAVDDLLGEEMEIGEDK